MKWLKITVPKLGNYTGKAYNMSVMINYYSYYHQNQNNAFILQIRKVKLDFGN